MTQRHTGSPRHRGNFSRNTSKSGGGSNASSSTNRRHKKKSYPSNNDAIFPSASLLQEYEYAAEGTVDRLLKMAEIEQARRNQWEKDYMLFHRKSRRMGQLFGFIILLAVIVAVVNLTTAGHGDVAKILAISTFSATAFTAIIGMVAGGRTPWKKRPRYQSRGYRGNNNRRRHYDSKKKTNPAK